MGGRPSRSTRSSCGILRSTEGRRSSQATVLAVSSEGCTEHTKQGQRLVSQPFKRFLLDMFFVYTTLLINIKIL